MDFQICYPYSMIEPLRDILANPTDSNEAEGEVPFSERVSRELRETNVELVADFLEIPTRISDVLSLKKGDILPIELPHSVIAHVDGVPVLNCGFGSCNGRRALSVRQILEIPNENPIGQAPEKALPSSTQGKQP